MQAWFYFGAINEVFGYKNIPASEFVRQNASGEWILCTARLEGRVNAWASYMGAISQPMRDLIDLMVKDRWYKDNHYLPPVVEAAQALGHEFAAVIF